MRYDHTLPISYYDSMLQVISTCLAAIERFVGHGGSVDAPMEKSNFIH